MTKVLEVSATHLVVLPMIVPGSSFLAKFYVLYAYWQYRGDTGLAPVLIGDGVSSTVEVIGVGAHNIVVTYGPESGWLLRGRRLVLFWLSHTCRVPVAWTIFPGWLVNRFWLTRFAVPHLCVAAALHAVLPATRIPQHETTPLKMLPQKHRDSVSAYG